METTTKKISYQEFRQMEFDESDRFFYELLNGELVKRSTPSPLHQRISSRLFNKINKRDRFEKMEIYQRFKAPEYWIVDPANSSIEVYTLQNDKFEIAGFAAQEGIIQSPVLGGWELEVKSVFE